MSEQLSPPNIPKYAWTRTTTAGYWKRHRSASDGENASIWAAKPLTAWVAICVPTDFCRVERSRWMRWSSILTRTRGPRCVIACVHVSHVDEWDSCSGRTVVIKPSMTLRFLDHRASVCEDGRFDETSTHPLARAGLYRGRKLNER